MPIRNSKGLEIQLLNRLLGVGNYRSKIILEQKNKKYKRVRVYKTVLYIRLSASVASYRNELLRNSCKYITIN